MQKKTIKKTIIKKLNDWLLSITDKQLREQVKKNLLLSGGSIASMLLKEQVNDFDIYIKDMDVLIKLAQYYCPDSVLDGRLREDYLKEENPEIFANGGFMHDGTKYVAEKWVRLSNLKKGQVKLDIPGEGIATKFKEGEEVEKYSVAFLSQNAISLTDDIQIVLRFHGDSETIHKTFDFIHSTNYFTFDEGLVFNNDALTSLLTKQLSYQGSMYPLTSIIRMKKFLGRGFNINAGEILKIMFQISLLDLTNIEVLEEQLIGVDVAYFAKLIEILRGVKKEEITSTFLNDLIDKVFQE